LIDDALGGVPFRDPAEPVAFTSKVNARR